MRIICFGDSNTYGYDPRDFFGGRYAAGDRWPELLETYGEFDVINLGANGRAIPRGNAALQLLRSYAPADIFLVMLDSNDLLQGDSAVDAAEHMEAFLTSLLPCFKRIFLIAPPPMQRGAWVPTDALAAESIHLAEEYRLLAEKLKIPFVDTRSWNISLCFDGVHFTEAGHHAFAKLLYKQLANLE